MSSKDGRGGASSYTGAAVDAGLEDDRAAREVVEDELGLAAFRAVDRGLRTYAGVAVDAKRTVGERTTDRAGRMNDMMSG